MFGHIRSTDVLKCIRLICAAVALLTAVNVQAESTTEKVADLLDSALDAFAERKWGDARKSAEEAEARAEYEADMADIRNDESYFDPDDWPEIDPEQWWPDDPDLARDIERGK